MELQQILNTKRKSRDWKSNSYNRRNRDHKGDN